MIEYSFKQITWDGSNTVVDFDVYEGDMVTRPVAEIIPGVTEETVFVRSTLLESGTHTLADTPSLAAIRTHFNLHLHDNYPAYAPVTEQTYAP